MPKKRKKSDPIKPILFEGGLSKPRNVYKERDEFEKTRNLTSFQHNSFHTAQQLDNLVKLPLEYTENDVRAAFRKMFPKRGDGTGEVKISGRDIW